MRWRLAGDIAVWKTNRITIASIKMVQFYTLDEVKQQNGQNGNRTWVVIHDCVYDATDYLADVRLFDSIQFITVRHCDKSKQNK